MLKEQAVRTVDLPHQAEAKYLEHRHYEITREVYQRIETSGLNKFTSSWIDSWVDGLNGILYRLDQLPDAAFKDMMAVIISLREARNELRLARFLFEVEEINPVHRLMMRNRAILRSEKILYRTLQIWPLRALSK